MTGLISRLRIRLLIAAAALALHTAQGQTVSGTVVDRLTREPIVGATVIDAATRKGTVSDIDGRFAISTAATRKARARGWPIKCWRKTLTWPW